MVEDVDDIPQGDPGGDDVGPSYPPPKRIGRPKGSKNFPKLQTLDEIDDDIPDNPDPADVRAWFTKTRKARLKEMWSIARDKETPLNTRVRLLERFDDMDRGKPAVQSQDDGGDEVGSILIEKF